MSLNSGVWQSPSPHIFGRPVVHLHVDVEVVVAVPRRLDALGPEALQVGGHVARARAADQQVPAEVEVERRQRRVGAALGQRRVPFVGRQRGRRAALGLAVVKLDAHAVEVAAVVGDVGGAQLLVRLGRRPWRCRRAVALSGSAVRRPAKPW